MIISLEKQHKLNLTAATILRVALGCLALAHAYLKIAVFTIPGTVQYFESIGYPGFFAYIVIAGELFGGLGLLFGVLTRIAALAMIPILIGATLQHLPNGWMFASPNGGWEFPVFWTVCLLVQSMLGKGLYTLPVPGFLKKWDC